MGNPVSHQFIHNDNRIAVLASQIEGVRDVLLDTEIVVHDMRDELDAAVVRLRLAVVERDRTARYLECLMAWHRELRSCGGLGAARH
jgi:hypothetical protein